MTTTESGGWGKPRPQYGAVREHDFRVAPGKSPRVMYKSRCRGWVTFRVDFFPNQDPGPEPAAIGGKRCKVCWRLARKEQKP